MRPVLTYFALLSAIAALDVAAADESAGDRSVEVIAETKSLPASDGSLTTLRGTYKLDNGSTTYVFAPQVGWRDVGTKTKSAVGLSATLYHEFSGGLSTRTMVATAEDGPVFARHQFAQEVTFQTGTALTGTVGGRWAQYFGSRDVYFLSAGARYYFNWGSVSYRLSHVSPDEGDSYLAHLVNFSVNDARGRGKTQLWLSTGEASFETEPLQYFSGDDYGATLRRVQPLSDTVSLIASVGYDSYDRPAGRADSTSFGLGIEFGL